MAIIHQTLYQNKNYSTINVSATILFLIQNILYSFNRTDIEIESDIEEIILDVNTAIPIALIINEAITNVVKYAFPENFTMSKKVFIQLKRKDFSIELSIKDNGIGIDKKMIQQLSNVGFSIIKALAEQINAQLFIYSEKNQGTEIKLLIPLL
jgi:two-component sensor histidine kinase